MEADFKRLLEQGDEDSLTELYEELSSHETGKSKSLLHAFLENLALSLSGPPPNHPEVPLEHVPSVDIDWKELEQIALSKTPTEQLAGAINKVPAWLWPFSVLLPPLILPATHAWASNYLVNATLADRLIVVLVGSVAITVSLVALGMTTWWVARQALRKPAPPVLPAQLRARSRIAVCGSTVAALAVVTLIDYADRGHSAHSLLGAGYTSLRSGNYPEAARQFQRAAKYDPDSPAVHLARGQALKEMSVLVADLSVQEQFRSTSLDSFMAAKRLQPDNPLANAEIGMLALSLSRYKEAQGVFAEALSVAEALPVRDGDTDLTSIDFLVEHTSYRLGDDEPLDEAHRTALDSLNRTAIDILEILLVEDIQKKELVPDIKAPDWIPYLESLENQETPKLRALAKTWLESEPEGPPISIISAMYNPGEDVKDDQINAYHFRLNCLYSSRAKLAGDEASRRDFSVLSSLHSRKSPSGGVLHLSRSNLQLARATLRQP